MYFRQKMKCLLNNMSYLYTSTALSRTHNLPVFVSLSTINCTLTCDLDFPLILYRFCRYMEIPCLAIKYFILIFHLWNEYDRCSCNISILTNLKIKIPKNESDKLKTSSSICQRDFQFYGIFIGCRKSVSKYNLYMKYKIRNGGDSFIKF